MNLKREFSMAQLGMLTGIDQNTIRSWMAGELLYPSRRGKARGKGRTLYFDSRHLVVVGLLATLRRAGATLQYAKPLANFIGRHTPAELKQAADDDMLLIYAGAAIPPRFVREGDSVQGRSAGFPELAFQTSMRDLWAKVEEGVSRADRMAAVPLS